jgi:hypothetical protein
MNRGDCQACKKPLQDKPGPVIMDRDDYRYHFDCWLDQMDGRMGNRRESTEDRRSTNPA